LGEAILELGNQYSVEESRHIISTSFPRHLSEWANIRTLEAQEWHFCNSAAHNGNFINNAGRHEVTTRIGFLFHAPAAHFIFYILSNHHFRSPSFHGGAPCSFSRFWLVFTVFMHI